MNKGIYNISTKIFEIRTQFDLFHKISRDFISLDNPDFIIETSKEMIEEYRTDMDKGYDDSLVEIALVHKLVAEKLIAFDTYVFHGSSFMIDNSNNGFIIIAKSGTGKSTHARLLSNKLKDRFTYINDDKPFLEYKESTNEFILHGSMWNGKHFLGTNSSAKLKGIISLYRGSENMISEMDEVASFKDIFRQIHIPDGIESTGRAMEIISKLTEYIKVYKLSCNMDEDAPDTTFKAIEFLLD